MGIRLRSAVVAFGVFAGTPVFVVAAVANGAPSPRVSASGVERPGSVRFANLTDDGALLDLVLDGRPRVVGMAAGRSTDFIVVPAGAHTIGVRRAGLATSPLIGELIVASGTSPTVLVLGDSTQPSMFTLPDVADSVPSVRVVNVAPQPVRVRVGANAVDVEVGGSALVPVTAGVVVIEAAVGDMASVRTTVDVGPYASMTAVVTGTPDGLAVHAMPPPERVPELLALQIEDSPVGPTRSTNVRDSTLVRHLLAGAVIVLVFAATLSSLAVFRVDSLDDRVRHRMR